MFRDREDAGRRLAGELQAYVGLRPLVLAIPRGGVPVGFRLAEGLGADFDILITRKIPIPWEPEAGFGAVGPDGEFVLSDSLIDGLGLSTKEIQTLAQTTFDEVRRREAILRRNRPRPSVRDRHVILVDDGLATGYTMSAALEWVRRGAPKELVVAVPCSSSSAIEVVSGLADTVVAMEVSHEPFFAVASFYERWTDLTDEEILPYLKDLPKRGHYQGR